MTGTRIGLFVSYLKGAWRSVARHRGYTALNLVGLSVAIASALVIGLFIRHSLSFDRFFPDVERTYRLVQERGRTGVSSRPAQGIGPMIRDTWSGVESLTEQTGSSSSERQLTIDGQHVLVDKVMTVDDHFLDVFPFQVVAATERNPLGVPNAIVLTESAAARLFGNVDALGKTIRLDASRDFTVTAIATDPPTNTHLPFNALVRGFDLATSASSATSAAGGGTSSDVNWNRWGARTYIRMAEGASPAALESHLNEMLAEAQPGAVSSFVLQPVTDIYLSSGVNDDYAAVGDTRYLLVFGSIGVLILVLACINYTNLATARASKRVREVGVRKVVGATQSQLRRQFLLESMVLASVAVPLAILLARSILPVVNGITGQQLDIQMLVDPVVIVGVVALVGLVAIGAGIYPAAVLARHDPSRVFSGGSSTGRSRHAIRRGLVGVQVMIAFGIIVSTLLVSKQMGYIRDQNLGFDQEQVVTIAPRGWTSGQFALFKERVEADPAIESAAAGVPVGINHRTMMWTRAVEGSDEELEFEATSVGPGFLETMGIPVIEGRDFEIADLSSDPAPVIVTAAFAATVASDGPVVGTEAPVGGTIIGVVSNFKNASFRDTDPLTVIQLDGGYTYSGVIRLAAGRTREGLDVLQRVWTDISPERAFVYEFLDERIQQQYVAERKLAGIFGLFAGMGILITTLGLFGLAAFTSQQRFKEIGIRKSLGASVSSIVSLLSREFIYIVLVGIAVITPFVYLAGNRWLANFSDHVALDVSLFAAAAGIALFFVLTAVGYQAIRAATANPTEALRHD